MKITVKNAVCPSLPFAAYGVFDCEFGFSLSRVELLLHRSQTSSKSTKSSSHTLNNILIWITLRPNRNFRVQSTCSGKARKTGLVSRCCPCRRAARYSHRVPSATAAASAVQCCSLSQLRRSCRGARGAPETECVWVNGGHTHTHEDKERRGRVCPGQGWIWIHARR